MSKVGILGHQFDRTTVQQPHVNFQKRVVDAIIESIPEATKELYLTAGDGVELAVLRELARTPNKPYKVILYLPGLPTANMETDAIDLINTSNKVVLITEEPESRTARDICMKKLANDVDYLICYFDGRHPTIKQVLETKENTKIIPADL